VAQEIAATRKGTDIREQKGCLPPSDTDEASVGVTELGHRRRGWSIKVPTSIKRDMEVARTRRMAVQFPRQV
jgi:hypothetical protein